MMKIEPIHNIIGHARTIRTTLLCVEYLRQRWSSPHSSIQAGLIRYRFYEPTSANGYWSSDIYVETYDGKTLDLDLGTRLVDCCRAFVAGAGEVWT